MLLSVSERDSLEQLVQTTEKMGKTIETMAMTIDRMEATIKEMVKNEEKTVAEYVLIHISNGFGDNNDTFLVPRAEISDDDKANLDAWFLLKDAPDYDSPELFAIQSLFVRLMPFMPTQSRHFKCDKPVSVSLVYFLPWQFFLLEAECQVARWG
jgi:hypothetical protein